MEKFLYGVVGMIARIHQAILSLNDAVEASFTDKELHFIVIGVLGMVLVFVIHPLFCRLAKNGHILVITFVYVFTLIIVLTFAIEIGQRVTKTGSMEFADIVHGVFGFLALFVIFAVIRAVVLGIIRLVRGK